jgi:unsaturated rhamnogalacturonyl hydrolase
MAIGDVLDFLPPDHPQRPAIIDIFERTVRAVTNVQDHETGLWYQVLDRKDWAGNYLEASASCMFVYAIAKAVRQRTIAAHYLTVARRGYQGILDRLVEVDSYGLVHLHWICGVAGLSKDRNGSVEYYLKEKVVTDDYKGIGPFIMASVEIEHFQGEE